MPVENTWRETGSDQKEKAGLSQHVPESIMLSKLKKSQSDRNLAALEPMPPKQPRTNGKKASRRAEIGDFLLIIVIIASKKLSNFHTQMVNLIRVIRRI